MLKPYWKEQTIPGEGLAPDYEQHLVIFCEPGEILQERIETQMKGVRCLTFNSKEQGIDKRFQSYAARAFEEIQGILKDKPKGQVLIQILVPLRDEQQLFSGLSGLLKTAQLENPKIMGQVIEVENTEGIVEKLKQNSRGPTESRIRYQDGKRWMASWREVEVSGEEVRIPWKENGIYLITGGAGGLGLIFAKEISQQAKKATVILTDRSPITRKNEGQLKELETLGVRIEYKEVDVMEKKGVKNLIESIEKDFGRLDGIIHGAGVIRDNFLLKKTKEELEEVLAPKVSGLVDLDEASKDVPLDFFIFFSSGAGAMGNIGQADYATANAFMDGYAKYRNDLVVEKQRHGQTLSMNWPLWKEGGMRVDAATEKLMKESLGLVPMQTSTGIQALYRGLASRESQVMVMEGHLARVKKKLLSMMTPEDKQAVSDSKLGVDTEGLLDKVQVALIRVVSKSLQVRIEEIDADTELIEYGFDSISLTEFGNQLNQEYKLELTPTIFFEYPTIHSFAGYLIKEHRDIFVSRFSVSIRTESVAQPLDVKAEELPSQKIRRSRFTRIEASRQKPAEAPEAIAVVGMSGRFPMAKDVNEFWQNLVEGKDCIVEIPKERWDWKEYYGDPTEEANKTNIKWGGFIEGVDEFDPLFFGISPREAELMDPQQRLLMTYVWKAIEDAGYSAGSLAGSKTAILVGIGSSGYGKLITESQTPVDGFGLTAVVPSVGPNRMSYFLNFHGPSEPIETACSSSLIAIHRAMEAIASRSCEMAIVGGINTIVTPAAHISFNKAGMLSEDGRCKTFSNKANGYVRGEGVGMLFLKKLK